jgi:pimeloyl-ACP methyl ester carboxylesterase
VEIRGAGHMMFEDKPEEWVDAVLDWLPRK